MKVLIIGLMLVIANSRLQVGTIVWGTNVGGLVSNMPVVNKTPTRSFKVV